MNSVLGAVFTVMALAAFASLLVLALTVPTSPLRIRHRIAAEVEAPVLEPEVEPRIPRDTSRTYPRPKGSKSKLNRVCPVCGTGQETGNTGNLDGRVLGWPAHRTCAEWLGDWAPARPEPPSYKPDRDLIGYMEQGQKPAPARTGGTNTVVFTGKGAITAAGGGGGSTSVSVNSSPGAQVNVGDGNAQVVWSESGTTDPVVLIANGMASIDEVRARLDREIAATGGMERQQALAAVLRRAGAPLGQAEMVGQVECVGLPAIWYIVCGCGMTVYGALEEMPGRVRAHRDSCGSRVAG